MNRSRYETVICKVDRTTGELIIPDRPRGVISALRRQFEGASLGLFAVGIIATLFSWTPTRTVHPAPSPPAKQPCQSAAKPTPDAGTISPPSRPPASKRVRIGSRIDHRYQGNSLVVYSEPLYETRAIEQQTFDRPAAAKTGADRININTATLDELDRELEGVGAVMAKRIMEARPFKSVDDLDKVPGIGPKRLAQLRSKVRVK